MHWATDVDVLVLVLADQAPRKVEYTLVRAHLLRCEKATLRYVIDSDLTVSDLHGTGGGGGIGGVEISHLTDLLPGPLGFRSTDHGLIHLD